MCVIAYYPADLELNEKELNHCFDRNPDGAGLMVWDERKQMVHIRKGFMDWKHFWKVAKTLPQDVDRVFHFRIATSGAVSKECCHPFPVCNDLDRMRLTDQYSKVGLAHNGIISWCTPTKGLKSPYSDSMIFTKEVIYELDKGFGVFNQGAKKLIEKGTSFSKFAVMKKNETILIGDFQQGESGAMYSNDSWEEDCYGRLYNYGVYGDWWDKLEKKNSSLVSKTKTPQVTPSDEYYKIFVPITGSSLNKETADTLCNIIEEQDGCVLEYVVMTGGILFTLYTLPSCKTIYGYNWIVTSYPTGYRKNKGTLSVWTPKEV